MKTLNLELQKRFNGEQFIYVIVNRRLPHKDNKSKIQNRVLGHYEKYEEGTMRTTVNAPPNMLAFYTNVDLKIIKKEIQKFGGKLAIEEPINPTDSYVYIYFLNKEKANEFLNWINSLMILNKIVGV